MSKQERKEIIADIAGKLNVNPSWLDALINFETAGTYSPTIKNPNSSARGLIQVINSTARSDFGVTDSFALVNMYPTFREQMYNVVYPYLKKYAPFPTKQSLYMAVFYPAFRNVSPTTPFPATVQKANTYTVNGRSVTISTPADYIRFVDDRIRKESLHFPFGPAPVMLFALFAGAIYLVSKRYI